MRALEDGMSADALEALLTAADLFGLETLSDAVKRSE